MRYCKFITVPTKTFEFYKKTIKYIKIYNFKIFQDLILKSKSITLQKYFII
jgi:hypothetical protein